MASQHNSLACAVLLVEAKADLELGHPAMNMTPLFAAAENGHISPLESGTCSGNTSSLRPSAPLVRPARPKRAVAEDWLNEIRLMKVKAGKPKPQYFRLLYADNGSDGFVSAFALLRGARLRELCCVAACSQDQQAVLVGLELFQWHPVLHSLQTPRYLSGSVLPNRLTSSLDIEAP